VRQLCNRSQERRAVLGASRRFQASGVKPAEIEHYIAVKEDITERKRLEEVQSTAQKLESLGTLAGGMRTTSTTF